MNHVSLAGGRIDEVADAESAHRICQEPRRGWESWWQWGSERLNPILIKEVRQSLKSRQFEISFGLTLLAAIGWTFIYVAMSVPRIYYMPGGMQLLTGYAIILLMPLLVVIPFAAFRSLTSEIEESTYELLSISNLSAKQIVTGKMATAALQILLYVSALAPCIVLTYLLRGVSLLAIMLLLAGAVAYAVMLVSAALVLATVARSRSGQSGMSVLLLTLLVISLLISITSMASGGVDEVLRVSPPRETFLVLFAAFTILYALFSLLMQTAAAAIDFASENKSTPIRWRLLLLLGVILFWLILMTCAVGESAADFAGETYQYFLVGFFLVWMAIGGVMCGERGVIAPRARRTLPKTFAGRVLLTWMGPGAGLGYIFQVAVFASVAILLSVIASYLTSASMRSTYRLREVSIFGFLLTCYFTFYVGLCRLGILAIGRRISSPKVASFSLLVVLLLFLQLVPYFLAVYWNDFSSLSYGWHQTFNIPLTLQTVGSNSWYAYLGNLIVLALAALAVFGLNLMLSTKDVMIVRLAAPLRVREEREPLVTEPAVDTDPFLA